MRIPRSVKIKKSVWKITLDETKLDTRQYNGMCVPDHKEILIDPKLPRNDLEETFIHELLHACFPAKTCSYNKEEEIVASLARVLTPVLKRVLKAQGRGQTTSRQKRANRRHR